MPKFSTKHKQREKTFRFDSFHGGFTQERVAAFLSRTELSACKNLKYVKKQTDDAQTVTLRKRQGTTKVSSAALPSAADVKNCTYYIAESQYVLATASKIYYLDGSSEPVEMGNVEAVPTFTEFNGKLIVHDGGRTKAWDGTDFYILPRSFYDELLATGDNSETEFAGTLEHYPLSEKTRVGASVDLSITFTDTTSKEINDDGIGRLTGDVDSAWVKNISGAADSPDTPGLIQITANAHGFSNGDEVNIQDIVGTTEANNTLSNPTWEIEQVDTNTFDLVGSTFANAYTSGGTASKNTIIYETGVYAFKADGAPDDTTLVEIDYEAYDNGVKSSAGFVRGSKLYLTGCADYLSRLYYTAANDEVAVDSSAGGGYLDIDPDDGHDLLGGINFETSILLGKQNSLHRIDAYPGDSDFKAEKITDDLGFVSHRTHLFEGHVVSFMSNEGWTAMHPSERYGDIQKGVSMSTGFKTNAAKYANSYAYSAYNPIDKQLWLALASNSGGYLDYIFVVNLETGGQLSLYKFAFGHSCFTSVNGEFLIGGTDGNLYKLDDTDSVFTDNEVDYSTDTYMRTSFEDWGLPNNWKHNKKISVDMSGTAGVSADLKIYKNENYTASISIGLSIDGVWGPIYEYSNYLIYDASVLIGRLYTNIKSKKKFNYRSVMIGIENISGDIGVEIMGVDLKTGLMGDK